MSKRRLTTIFDKTSSGTSTANMFVGLDIALNKDIAKKLKRCMRDNARKFSNNILQRDASLQVKPLVHFVDGSGEDMYLWIPTDKAGNVSQLRYSFKEQGSHVFLNVSCNPSIIAVGSNTQPIIMQGMDLVEGAQFQYLLPFTILEDILDFQWKGKAAISLRPENVSTPQIQLAMYSGDLGDSRNDILRFIRAIYCSIDRTKDGKTFVGANLLGISGVAHDNHDNNVTLQVKNPSGHRLMSVSFYCKDDSLSSLEKEDMSQNVIDGLGKRIRLDITLYNYFLANYGKMNNLQGFLDKYAEKIGESETDEAFGFWIRNLIMDRIKLPSILRLKRVKYYKFLDAFKETYASKDNLLKYFEAWKAGDTHNMTIPELCEKYEMSKATIDRVKLKFDSIFAEQGFDVSLPLEFVDHIFYYGSTTEVSKEERAIANRYTRGSNRMPISLDELHDRFADTRKSLVDKVFEESSGMFKISRVPARRVDPDKLYVHDYLP